MNSKNNKILRNWLRFAEDPEQYLLEVKKQSDIFLTLSVFMFISSIYMYFLTDITHILISVGMWVSGMAATFFALLLSSIKGLRVLHKHVSIDSIRGELDG